jgi:hypothetical protein
MCAQKQNLQKPRRWINKYSIRPSGYQLEKFKEKSKLVLQKRKSQRSSKNDIGTKWYKNVINGTWQRRKETIGK